MAEQNITFGDRVIGTTTRQYAQKFDFAELKRMMTQNVAKSGNKSFAQYTKDKLVSYLKNPYANIDNIRAVSQYIYMVSQQYKTLINYLSNMLVCSYNVVYETPDWNKKLSKKTFMAQYQEICRRLHGMNLEELTKVAIATCIRDGIWCGFIYDPDDEFYVCHLDPKYVKISSITKYNTYVVKFNAAYFDIGYNKEFVLGIPMTDGSVDTSGCWDQVFIDGYNDYKEYGKNAQWFELPVEKTMCIICGDDPNYPMPFFQGLLIELLNLLDYRDLIADKAELENYVLLISKVPMIQGSNQINDYSVDLNVVKATQAAIDETLPSLAASAYTPCDIEVVRFDKSNTNTEEDIYEKSIRTLLSNAGISQMLFNDDKSGSVGLRHSIRVDESVMFGFLNKVEKNVRRYLELNVSDEFEFSYHRVTIFGLEDYTASLKDKATLGINVLTYATTEKDPYQVMNETFMVNAMGLQNTFIPLNSSYTSSTGSGTVGRPTTSDDDLTDEGAASRDGNKNETTKAGK